MAEVQVLAVDDVEFLERGDATLCFRSGKKIGLEWIRDDGVVLHHSGWTVGECINAARASLRTPHPIPETKKENER